ncbi:type II secretion system protein GspM [Alteromonas oceanisediminis]|uniref:type II secretion system protein GspM n=1 Tax=Alteromonas oceanisediminis TaxID=2836180 RepID=UPI001BDB04BC|nr:type II secretion system protein M [Alteromonas oceanisediminis]MBT0587861.1 type II secretion system protein M [Alteromonas oceanisediminis]
MQALLARFRALTEREQILVITASVVVLIGLFYFFIWSPLNTNIERQRNTIADQQELLTWVQQSAQRAIQLRQSGRSGGAFNGSLPQAVNQTTARYDIAISRMQPQGDELQVWVDQAAFNSVIDWLNALETMGVVILQVDVTEAESPGQIRIRRLQLGKA